MPPPTNNDKEDITQKDIAIALLNGGLSWEQTKAILDTMNEKKVFERSYWNGAKIIRVVKE